MQEKDALRKEMLEKRDSLPLEERERMSAAVMSRLWAVPQFSGAKCVAFYLSKSSEVDTLGMAKKALEEGKEILVPVTAGETELVKFTSFEDLAPAKFGVLEPKTKIPAGREPDVIIVPGLAFDSDLHRLGYGKGHYDRLLKKLKSIKIGICFDFQIVKVLPRHGHDVRMDLAVSEKRIMRLL